MVHVKGAIYQWLYHLIVEAINVQFDMYLYEMTCKLL